MAGLSRFQIGLLLAMVLLAPPAAAQSATDIKVDDIGTCPPENILRGFPGVTQPTVGIGLTLTKLPGVHLDRSADGSQPTRVIVPFNTQLIVFGSSADEQRLFVRSVPSGANAMAACGWVATDTVLIPPEKKFQGRYKKPQPLQMRDISETQEASNNMLNVKAVVHDLSIAGETTGIDVFEDPRTGHPTDKIRLFDAFLVFDKMKLTVNDPNQETRYWLIGERIENSDATSLKGWIRQRDVVIWPSRLAVQWNEEATVSGYAYPENLNRKTGQVTLPDRIERVDYPEQITRRLPVLEQYPPPDRITEALPTGGSLEERLNTARNIIHYYKIATPGIACRKDNRTDCMSARQIDLQREKIANAEIASMKMDILILIDATESMDPYLPSTVKTIDLFVSKAGEEDIRRRYDLRFGISLYGDYQTQEATYDKVDYREIVPFFKPGPGLSNTGPMQVLVNNPKSLIFGDVHRDKLEAPFAAVIRAAKTSRWRPLNEVPLRFIVHIGDAGNRDRGQTSADTQLFRYPNAIENNNPPRSTIREQYGLEEVSAALREAHAIYVPVVIEEGSMQSPVPSIWNRIFIDQSDGILNILGIDAPSKKTVITYSKQSSEDLVKAVIGSIVTILAAVQNGFDYKKCEPNSKAERCIDLRNNEAAITKPEIVRLVDRVASVAAGLTSDEINNIYSRDQSIVTMYSPARSVEGKEMFTHWVALERREFKLLRDLLRTLCDNMSTQDAKNPVMKALREFSEMYSSEDFTDLTVREILGKRLGIPNLERTDFSGRTRDEIDDAYRAWQSGGDRTTWDIWHLRACKASTFTQLMEDEKKIDPNEIRCDLRTNTCEAPERAQHKFRWSVQVSQDSPTYYIPLDILP
jgi:hypothetical protein